MAESTFTTLTDNLKQFRDSIVALTRSDKNFYDKEINQPNWRNTQGVVESFSADVIANVSKFIQHIHLLENENDVIDDVRINTADINRVAQRLIGNAAFYQQQTNSVDDKKLCEQVIRQLSNIDKVLGDYSRPAGPGQNFKNT